MLCQVCGQSEGCIPLKQIIGGQKQTLVLCAPCFMQHGLSIDPKWILEQSSESKPSHDWLAIASEFEELADHVAELPTSHEVNAEDLMKMCAELKAEQPTEAQLRAADALLAKIRKLQGGGKSRSSRRRKAALEACPACGFTLQDFKKHRRFGCAEDYEVFAPQVREMLLSVHGKAEHRGRQPARMAATQARARQIIALKTDLEAAIQSEDFESAATLRDKLRLLEEGGDTDVGTP
jgi:protein arginine kinase activator